MTSLVALATAGYGGLLRAGWAWPALPTLATAHAPLLVGGSVGVLVGLVRAVVVRSARALVAPGLAALAVILSLAGAPVAAVAAAQLASGLALAMVLVAFRAPSAPRLATATSIGGALSWCVASVVLASGGAPSLATPWWIAFLVLIVIGQRLELDRSLRPRGAVGRALVAGALALVPAGAALALVSYADGLRVAGAAMIAVGMWSLANDGVRHLLPRGGLARFHAVAVVSALAWLVAAGALALAYDGDLGGPRYDAFVHATTTGFLLLAIVAHEPTFMPGALGVALAWSPRFYVPLVLLHAGVALRVALDLAGDASGARSGGAVTGLAMIAFLAGAALAARPRRPVRPPRSGPSALPPGSPRHDTPTR